MIEHGGPAFPIERITAHGILAHTGIPEGDAAYIEALAAMTRGMTMRDYFAAKALAAMLAEPVDGIRQSVAYELSDKTTELFSKAAYQFADAMLRARNS